MNTSTSRRIEYAPLDDVLGTEANPRNHDLPAVIKSIAVLGFTSPAVVDERTGRLIVGNGRLQALKIIRDYVTGEAVPDQFAHVFREARVEKGLTAEDGSRRPPDGIDVTDGIWSAPLVRGWASHNEDHARAAVIADNKLSERSTWDDATLAEWLDEILDTDTDLLEVTGFNAEDLDVLLRDCGAYADRTAGYFDSALSGVASAPSPARSDSPHPGDVATDVVSDGRTEGELEFVQVSWLVNADQRKTIRLALARAQKIFGVSTSAMALAAIAERFLSTHPDQGGPSQ